MKLIQERHNKNIELSKRCFSNKLTDKRAKFEINHDKYLLSKKQDEELREEKIFKKYEGYVRKIFFIYLYIVFHNEKQESKRKRKKTNC